MHEGRISKGWACFKELVYFIFISDPSQREDTWQSMTRIHQA